MTFYYHFQDIYELAEWVCIEDGKQALKDKKTYDTWQEGMIQVFEAVLENKPFIVNIYRSVDKAKIENYLYKLSYQLIADVVDEKCAGDNLSENDKQFIADFYKYGFVGIMLDWVDEGMKDDYHKIVEQLSITLRGNIAFIILKSRCKSSRLIRIKRPVTTGIYGRALMSRTSDMKKRLPGIILITGGIVLVAMVIQAVILSFINNRSFDRTSQVLLDQVSNVIEKNKASEEDLIDSLKEDYMVRAKAVAYIVDAKPEVANDVDELRKIAALILMIREQSIRVRYLSILDIALIPGSRWRISSRCLMTRISPCVRMSLRTHQMVRR